MRMGKPPHEKILPALPALGGEVLISVRSVPMVPSSIALIVLMIPPWWPAPPMTASFFYLQGGKGRYSLQGNGRAHQ